MYSFPNRPEDNTGNKDAAQLAEERRERDLLEMATTELPAASSWGERLLPVLYAAIETCWLDAILIGLASIDLFQTRESLMPLWAPFVLMAGSYWMARHLERHAINTSPPTGEEASPSIELPGTPQFIALISVATVILIWLRFYSQTNFLLDPRWLFALLNDILFLNLRAWQTIFLVALSLYLCWRGVRLSRRSIDPSHINFSLCLGLAIILFVILIRAGQESAGVVFRDEATLLLLIPIFLFLALAAHALARVSFVRRVHPIGLEGSIRAQEYAVLYVLGTIGLILFIIALTLGSIASPTFLADVQQALAPIGAAYDWLVGVFAQLAVFIVTPIFWFFSWLFSIFHPQPPRPRTPPTQKIPPGKPTPVVPPETLIALTTALKFVLPVLFVMLMFFLIRRVLRRRRVRIVANRKDDELRESLWSWQLFWTQFKLFFRALFGRFFARHTPKTEEQLHQEEIKGEPAARTIREIYRALLKKAATHGYPRNKTETPYEFEHRLDEKVPIIEPQLAEITTAYTATRYGEIVPDEAEAARIQKIWTELNQNWQDT